LLFARIRNHFTNASSSWELHKKSGSWSTLCAFARPTNDVRSRRLNGSRAIRILPIPWQKRNLRAPWRNCWIRIHCSWTWRSGLNGNNEHTGGKGGVVLRTVLLCLARRIFMDIWTYWVDGKNKLGSFGKSAFGQVKTLFLGHF